MSIFGNAIDELKSIDNKYDSWDNEFVNGKKRVFTKSGLKGIQVNGNDGFVEQIDSSDEVFLQVDFIGEHHDKPPIYESNITIRAQEHISSLNADLSLFSRKVGLGDGFYKFENGNVDKTATEIISSNSTLFRNLKKQELPLNSALEGLVKAILFWGNLTANNSFNIEQTISINFDDSIIEDTAQIRQQAMQEFNCGAIDLVEYIAITRKLTREQADKKVKEMEDSNTMKEFSSLVNGGGMF
jgi:A118 family predicted phage portal protein